MRLAKLIYFDLRDFIRRNLPYVHGKKSASQSTQWGHSAFEYACMELQGLSTATFFNPPLAANDPVMPCIGQLIRLTLV